MNQSASWVSRLHLIRNRYGAEFLKEKTDLLSILNSTIITGKGALKTYYETLLFLIAYPDNKAISIQSSACLNALQLYLQHHPGIAWSLFNTGVTGTQLCAGFSFEMIKWLRQKHRDDIYLENFEANDGQIRSIISAVMPKVESEILQDENAEWKEWLQKTGNKGEDLLDKFIRIFDQSSLRPEVKDELWLALGINVTITLSKHTALPPSLVYPYYHRSLVKTKADNAAGNEKATRIKLTDDEKEQIVDCARMILIRHLREIDPITFTSTALVDYYKLPRGITLALFGMIPERRHPIDCYMGYAAFKNGLPIAYAGSWVLFDSARIGLNVFPAYRGGESRYTFEEVMHAHQQVYRLKRFTVDPYQIGKSNDDGIHSGAFWLYHHMGYRPIKEKQKKLAEEEAAKIKSSPGYRTPASTLKILADSRMELVLKPQAVRFDAIDVSMAYANILKKQYNNNRKVGELLAFNKLVKMLGIKNSYEANLNYVLKNWAVLLMSNEAALRKNPEIKTALKKLFTLKAYGIEEDFMAELNRCQPLRKIVEGIIAENGFVVDKK